MVPNATLPRAPFDLQNFKADGSSTYANSSGYSLMQQHSIQNPSGEHVAQLTGATTPLHHATDVKESNAISPTSPNSDPQRSGKQIPDNRSSSTGKTWLL